MENQKNNSEKMEKTIDNLKNELVEGKDIMGGGSAIGGGPEMPPIVPGGPIPSPGGEVRSDGSVVDPYDGNVLPDPILPDGSVIMPDSASII